MLLGEDFLSLTLGKWKRGKKTEWREGGDTITFNSELISNFHCREQMAQLRPIYKISEVRGHFSVESLLPPVASTRKIRLLFKNILSLLLEETKTKNCWQAREKAENLLVFQKSPYSLRDLGKMKHPNSKPLQTTKL